MPLETAPKISPSSNLKYRTPARKVSCELWGPIAIVLVDLDYLKGVRREAGRYLLADRELTVGRSYRYKVRSFQTDGTQSRDSNKAERTAHTPPLPPAPTLLPSLTSITVTFASPPLAEGTQAGYNIYRRTDKDPTPLTPVNAAPLTSASYQDQALQHGVRYGYSVTGMVRIGNELVESAPSAELYGSLVEPD